MGYHPVGEGLTGRGERPFPCRSRFPLNGIYRSPPPPGRSAASSRPLERGRAVRGDWPDGRGRGREQDSSGGFHREPGEGMLFPGSASMGYHPRGGGADGEAETSPPSPVARVPLKTSLAGTPPPPGRASVWRLTRWPCPGLRQDLSECHLRPRRDCQIPGHRIDGESSRGGRKRSPRPYLIVSPKTPLQSGSQPPGLPPPRGHNQR